MITETTSADGRLPITSPRLVEALIHTVSDMAILVGETGEVEDVTCNISDLEGLDAASWVGQQIEDVVTEECEGKIRSMLRAARAGEEGRWREINHPLASGEPVPIRYQAVGAGEKVMLLGRDLRAVAQLQSRLVKAQQAMDQDYGRLRQMETRYRVLFQTSSEPLLIADAETGRIQEVNAAAARLLGADAAELTNTALARVFGDPDRTRLEGIVNRLLSTGGSESMTGFARDGETQIELGITLFRAAESMMLLCRMRSVGKRARQEAMIEQMLVGMVARMADAVVVTDLEGRVLWCNDAFLAMAEVALGEEVRGEALGRFLARPGVDMDVILTNARTHGRLRAFDSVITGAFGSTTRVEISAANLPNESPPAIGFVMRDITRPPETGGDGGHASASKSVDNLVELVGSVPLKELVRASTDEIEKMCIETALKMTGNNRAAAAEMLGLSRQSLYVKLRRFGLVDSEQAD